MRNCKQRWMSGLTFDDSGIGVDLFISHFITQPQLRGAEVLRFQTPIPPRMKWTRCQTVFVFFISTHHKNSILVISHHGLSNRQKIGHRELPLCFWVILSHSICLLLSSMGMTNGTCSANGPANASGPLGDPQMSCGTLPVIGCQRKLRTLPLPNGCVRTVPITEVTSFIFKYTLW